MANPFDVQALYQASKNLFCCLALPSCKPKIRPLVVKVKQMNKITIKT
jgi:hypothetical protein